MSLHTRNVRALINSALLATAFGLSGFQASAAQPPKPPTIESRVAALESQVAALTTAVQGLQTTVASQSEQIAALAARVGPLESKVAVMNGALGIGTISGETGTVLAEASQSTPSIHDNQMDFVTVLSAGDLSLLAQRAEQLTGESTGGSASYSKAISYEVLNRAEGAVLLKAGSEISYTDSGGKKTDFLVSVGGSRLGVSVTRAYAPANVPFSPTMATTLLTRKLEDILASNANVQESDRWMKQILHVIADDQAVNQLLAAFAQLDASIKGNTIVYITGTDGADNFLYD